LLIETMRMREARFPSLKAKAHASLEVVPALLLHAVFEDRVIPHSSEKPSRMMENTSVLFCTLSVFAACDDFDVQSLSDGSRIALRAEGAGVAFELGVPALGVGPCSVSGTGEMQGFAMLLKKSREGRTRRSLRTDYFGISRLQATWR
jgi:hypothetical protein